MKIRQIYDRSLLRKMQSQKEYEGSKGGDYERKGRENQNGHDGILRKVRDKNVQDYGNEKIGKTSKNRTGGFGFFCKTK